MSRPWMPLYIKDYRGDTARLTTIEHGAYMLLIMEYWDKGGLPDDDAELAYIAGLSKGEWAAIRPHLRRFFQNGWRHKRIDEELAKADKAYERRALAGRKGGEAKAAASNARQEASNATADSGDFCQPQPESESDSRSSSETEARERAFAAFWRAWPHKVGRLEAERAFAKVYREAPAIMAGLERYIRGKPEDRPWLNPATFLRRRRFEDRPASAPPARGPPSRRMNPHLEVWINELQERRDAEASRTGGSGAEGAGGVVLDLTANR